MCLITGEEGFDMILKIYLVLVYLVATSGSLCSIGILVRVCEVKQHSGSLFAVIFVGLTWFTEFMITLAPPVTLALLALFISSSEHLRLAMDAFAENMSTMYNEDITIAGTTKARQS